MQAPGDARQPEPRVVIEMGGPNIVIRSTTAIDHADTTALADAVNAAADTDTVVVIDPESIRCDDQFAANELPESETTCTEHVGCHPTPVEAVACGVIQVAAEQSYWSIDVLEGRYCQTDRPVDTMFIDPAAWTPVIAVCVTPTRVSALDVDGVLVSGRRAHQREERLVASAR